MKRRLRLLGIVLLVLALWADVSGLRPVQGEPLGAPETPVAGQSAVSPNDRFGIAHISYGGQVASDERYRLALAAGARWNRWVAYWHQIERAPGAFDFERYDATVQADRRQGLQLDVVLMGTPAFYATPAGAPPPSGSANPVTSAPRNLDQPVFADGSDDPAPGKAINPENYWARFVNATVARYKDQVRHWEMWNEPDFSTFWWTGDGQEVKSYVRLLKVGYLAAKAADPEAQVLAGGLMYWEWAQRTGSPNAWLKAFLDELSADPGRERYGYYFDVLPLHWYARSTDLYDKTLAVRQLLAERGIAGKPIWINETNLSVCGDPQTGGKPDCTADVAKGRPEEQASFILQASANAIAADVEKIFAFQLNDDNMGPFEYYGLVRGDNSLRPAYTAYQVAARYFRDVTAAAKVSAPPVEAVTMLTGDGKVVIVVWNAGPDTVTVSIPAQAPAATLIDQGGDARSIPAQGGSYALTLPGATLRLLGEGGRADYPVGGFTYVIVEKPVPAPPPPSPSPTATVSPPRTAPASPTATPSLPPAAAVLTPAVTPGATVTGTSRLTDGPSITGTVRPSALPTQPTPTPALGRPERPLLLVPPSLSTLRISDVREDSFAISWASTVPATGTVRCGTAVPPGQSASDVRGAETRALIHLVAVRDLQPATTYLCEAQSGVELDDNGGAYFRVTTLPRPDAPPPSSPSADLGGVVVDEQGRPRPGAVVYAALDRSGAPSDGGRLAATLTDDQGRWTLDLALPPAVDAGATSSDAPDGDYLVHLTAVAATGLAAERTISAGDSLAVPLQLRFTWSPYRTAAVSLSAGWNEVVLPFPPLNPHTIADFAREVAARGGRVTEVYWQENDRWAGGPTADSQAPLMAGRTYLVKADTASTWTLLGQSP